MSRSENREPLISVVVPVYNEAEVIAEFWRRLEGAMDGIEGTRFHAIFVDDGSSDGSYDMLRMLAKRDSRVSVLKLSRNFGKESAMTAGLDFARGEWTVIIDADLQDPPELIPKMLQRAQLGYDVVLARRATRQGESWHKKWFARMFYRLMGALKPGFRLPPDTGDYRLMSRRAVEAIGELRESHRFMKGIFAWIGFPTYELLYDRDPRHDGHSKFNFFKLLNHAIDGITSFSTAPLRFATYFGLFVSLLAFTYGSLIVIKTLIFGEPVAGFPTIMTSILFIGGVQLLCIGVIGEYVGRIYGETKHRPLYLLEEIHGTAPTDTPETTAPAAGGMSSPE
ncbi:MAG: glycosyltransferase family 2 protein [Nevskiales bacterium]|nr:glycosyltransferase family 2 protein [Nevskiales bacterium]